MDLMKLFNPLIDFFMEMCAVEITMGGVEFTLGALWIWCAIACVLIGFIRGLAN